MALIRCEDCGHKVSDLAFACPRCARPTAARPKERGVSAGTLGTADDRPAGAPSVPNAQDDVAEAPPLPTSLAEWHEQLRVARASTQSETKRCLECDVNVSLDAFRARSGDAYLCGDCRDIVVRRQLDRQFLLRRVMLIATLVAALTVVMGAVLYLVQSATLRTKSSGKR